MLTLPFFTELTESKSILIAGAGGGFDIFAGLPLYFALKDKGIDVHLANLSFSFGHGEITGKYLTEDLVEVNARSKGNEYYFPEGYLSRWFARKREERSLYCLRPAGPQRLLTGYRALHTVLKFDTIVLVDGGIDSILRGDEKRIGTPVEDMSSISAVSQLAVERKFVACLGFGAETDVSHAHALETISKLIEDNAYLGALALTTEMSEVKRFMEAVHFVFGEMRGYESVICSSVVAALEGKYGDHHQTRRTLGSKLWINPLMQLYWFFRLEGIVRNVPYLPQIANVESLDQVRAVIKQYRDGIRLRDTFDRLSSAECE